MAESLNDFLQEVRNSMHSMHPTISRYPDIAAAIASEVAYEMWRKQRCFDHSEITFGARTPDGSAGYTIKFHEQRAGGRQQGVTLTRRELVELVEKATEMLGVELWRSRSFRAFPRTHGGDRLVHGLP